MCSINQQQMLAVSMGSASLAYNQLSVYRLQSKDPVAQSVLTAAFSFLVARHESLRTSFATTAAGAVQRLHTPDFCPANLRCRAAPEGVQQVHGAAPDWVTAAINKDMLTPFELDKAPLFRATLYEVRAFRHLLQKRFFGVKRLSICCPVKLIACSSFALCSCQPNVSGQHFNTKRGVISPSCRGCCGTSLAASI